MLHVTQHRRVHSTYKSLQLKTPLGTFADLTTVCYATMREHGQESAEDIVNEFVRSAKSLVDPVQSHCIC